MENIKQHDHRTTRRPDCVTEIRMGNTVLVVSGFFKKDTTSTAADKMARVLEAEAAATPTTAIPARTFKGPDFKPCLQTLKPGKSAPS